MYKLYAGFSHHIPAFLAIGTTWFLTALSQGQEIHEVRKLLAQDGAAHDSFGLAVDIDDDFVAITALGDDDAQGFNIGAVYLFDASDGAQINKLVPTPPQRYNNFGRSVSIAGGSVAVGAEADDDNGQASGAVYVFDAATGAQLLKILATDGAPFDQFGWSVAIHQGMVAVGAKFADDLGGQSGSAYVFDSTSGAQIAKLLPSDGNRYDEFGYSIAIDAGIVAVGARLAGLIESGVAYLFDASTGTQLARLIPDDSASSDGFGSSVAIADGVVAVGSPGHDAQGNNSGAAYLFDASTGELMAKLLPADGVAGDAFGWSIDIHRGIVIVGAYRDDGATGSAYLFDASTGTQLAKLIASDGEFTDYFGYSVAVSDGTAISGAYNDDDNGNSSGAAYQFNVPTSGCRQDLTGDGEVNTQDFIFFLNAWANKDPVSDWNNDGTINTQDFIAYLNDWVVGC